MRNILVKIIGPILFILNKILIQYKTLKINKIIGGGKRNIRYPFTILGIENIIMDENVSIGPGSTIFTTGAKLYIKSHVIIGPNLTVISGDHKYLPMRFLDSITAAEKENIYDQDITIEKDVWIGANVTILKGVTIGQSSIIAAGALVLKDVPPFTIVGGVPAKVIKRKFTEKDEEKHREFLCNNN